MDELYKISERIKDLMAESNLTYMALGNKLGKADSCISRWTRKNFSLRLVNLLALSKIFKCSLEYLVGRVEYDDEYVFKECPPFMEALQRALKASGKKMYHLNKYTKIKESYIHDWRHGVQPTLSSLLVIADYLGCTLDFLVGRE